MNIFRNTKNRRITVLLIFLVGLTLANFAAINFLVLSGIPLAESNSNDDNTTLNNDDLLKIPKNAEYSKNIIGTGETDLPIQLHQSLNDTTAKNFPNIDSANIFTEPFPRDGNFQSNYINMSIDNIAAPNKSLIIEDDDNSQVNLGNYYTSFRVRGDCWLENISLLIFTSGAYSTFTFDINGATYDITSGTAKYDIFNDLTGGSNLGIYYNNTATPYWYNLTNKHIDLDVDNTYDNTFFIRCSSDNGQGYWRNGDHTDGDETISWQSGGTFPVPFTDLTLKVGLSPKDHTPTPTEIGLKINGTAVGDIADTQGFWNKTTPSTSGSGNLEFEITADWYDVSCRVTDVQINYTDTSLTATSTYNASLDEQNILWNVTRSGGLNYFDSRIDDYNLINFTIPSNWIPSSIQVWNGSDSFSYSSLDLGNGYTRIRISNAGNGTWWQITANSTNLIDTINTYDDLGTLVDTIDYTKTLEINATLKQNIDPNNGDINLTIYNEAPSNIVNHTRDRSIFEGIKEITVDNWVMEDNVTEYGTFRIQVLWSNGTAVGFEEDSIIILGETELILTTPAENTFDADEVFNITIYCNDTGQNLGYIPEFINYTLNDGVDWRWDEIYPTLTQGEYNITIYCNDTQFNGYGPKTIKINASRLFYYNQSETYEIKILAVTEIQFIGGSGGAASYDSNEIFNITVEYNDTVLDKGIVTNDINYSIGGNAFRGDNVVYIGDGQYNITIYCNDTDFGVNYSPKTILIHANKTYYHNKTLTTSTITITGMTSMSLKEPSLPSVYYSDQSFNITITFNDTSRNSQGIEGGSIEYQLNNTDAQFRADNWVDLGGGNYNITINCDTTEFFPYGLPILTINISKQYYNNQSYQSNLGDFTIIGVSELGGEGIEGDPPFVFYSDGSFNFSFYFNDTIRNTGIEGATIEYRLNNTGAQFRSDNWVDLGGGNYNITIYCNETEFYPYGRPIITIHINKTYYNNQSTDTDPGDITIIGVTDITAVRDPSGPDYASNELFNVTVYFNDTVRNEGIINIYDLTVEVNETIYTTMIQDYGTGKYNITVNCSDDVFFGLGYGYFVLRVNISRQYYENQSREVTFNIGAATNLTILKFPDKVSYNSSETFNITAFYQDVGNNEGIDGATITVRINNFLYTPLVLKDFGNGIYNITIECNATQFGDYGLKSINVTATKIYCNPSENITNVYVVGETSFSIVKVPDKSYYSSSENFNITAYFYDTSRNQGINGSSIFLYVEGTPYTPLTFFDNGDGYYNISVNANKDLFNTYGFFTIRVDANKTYYYNQTDTLNVFIMGNTTLAAISPAEYVQIVQGTIFNITVNFEDVELISGVAGGTIKYTLNGTDYRSDKWNDNGDGTYNITIDIDDTDFNNNYGFIDIIINASKSKFINRSITFTIQRQIQTSIDPDIVKNFGNIYRGDNVSYIFNYTDISPKPILGADISIIGSNEGFIWQDVEIGDGNYTIRLNSTYVVAQVTVYTLQFRINATGNETQIITIQITVLLPKTEVLDITHNIADEVIAEGFNLTLTFNFTNAYNNKAITTITTDNVTVMQESLFWYQVVGGGAGDPSFANGGWKLIHKGDGNYTLNISTYQLTVGNLYTIIINITYTSPNPGPFNYSIIPIEFYYGSKPGGAPGAPVVGDGGDGGDGGDVTTGIPILWIIIAVAIVGSVAAIVGIQKGVIAPKKREKERILREVTTIFDDAINTEHVLVIHKKTGTCVFFKSYGMEEIDPQLVSGFLTAVSSFGREMDSQEALNEIQYGDKMLLLADGDEVRVALVLDKEASIFLRRHLKEFVEVFEGQYKNELIGWTGRIDIFRAAGVIVDDTLNTSIILPHEIKYDLRKVKSLKGAHSRGVLNVAQKLIKESERKFFFIASLLTEAIDRTGKDKAEVFMGIRELRDKNILCPIQITAAIEAVPASQQEVNLIRQKVSTLPGLSDAEKENVVSELSEMGAAEREAYLASLRERKEIVSAPIKTKAGKAVIDNPKSAKKEVNNMKKAAKTKAKSRDYQGAIEIYQNAAVIANNWDLKKDLEDLEDTIRITQIDGLQELKKMLEKEAKTAEKRKNYAVAAQKYKEASRAANEIFKLGITEMYQEVKRFTTKSKELEKRI